MYSQECMGHQLTNIHLMLCLHRYQQLNFFLKILTLYTYTNKAINLLKSQVLVNHSFLQIPLRFSFIVSITVKQNWVDIRLTMSKEKLSYWLSLSKVSCKTNITKFHHTSICNPLQQCSWMQKDGNLSKWHHFSYRSKSTLHIQAVLTP